MVCSQKLSEVGFRGLGLWGLRLRGFGLSGLGFRACVEAS